MVDTFLVALCVWGELFYVVWAFQDELKKGESESIQDHSFTERPGYGSTARFSRPKTLTDRIGYVGDIPIYRHATIDGRLYEFQRALPIGEVLSL